LSARVFGLQQPVMGVSRNPLLDLREIDMHPVPVGVSLASLKPEAKGALRCYRNGEPLYPVTGRQFKHYQQMNRKGRADDARRYLGRAARRGLNWQNAKTRPGDIVTWHEIPQDKEDGRTLLQIAAVIVSIAYPAFAPYAAAAMVAFNIFVPPTQRNLQQLDAANGVFSTSLDGNQARLDQPIWRNCGLNKITPPFAAQPYYEFLPSGKKDGEGRDIDADQYYFVVFAVGMGRNDPRRVLIGKTPATHFQDILESNYLKPGEQPHRALCNVTTSTEVAGLEMESDGRYIGGYVASQPRRKAVRIGIDMAATQGLGTTETVGEDAGQPKPITISWRIEAREIDNYARPLTTWVVLGDEERTGNTNTPQRWTSTYTLTTPARVEVRAVRTDIKDTNPNTRNALQWIGLRAYLQDGAPLQQHCAHYEIVMRASEQLSGQAQRDFAIINQGYARTWHPDTGWSCFGGEYDSYTATRNPAWYLADLWTDPNWGEGLPDERIDLQGLYEWSLVCDARQDRFDYTFDKSMNAWDAAQLIARAGRARCFRRFGINTIARDDLQTLPKTAFSPRNTLPGTMACDETTPGLNVSDGYVIEFKSNVSWDVDTVDCPCPGFTVRDPGDPRHDPALPIMSRPIFDRIDGIQGAIHAEREGLFQAAAMMLRTRTVSCTTTMEGMVLAYMDPLRWQPEVGGFGQSGDVTFWNPETLVMGLSEPADFAGSGSSFLTLMRDDGSLTDAVEVTPGLTTREVQLPSAPDFEIILDDGTRDRPKFFLGHLDQMARITSIADGGKSDADDGEEGAQLFEITGFIDDERVHTADLHLLPGPGEIQDPVDDGDDAGGGDGGGDTLILIRLTAHELVDGQAIGGGGIKVEFTMRNNGTMSITQVRNDEPDTHDVVSEWALVPVEVTDAARFEVMVAPPAWANPSVFGSAINTWLSLDTERSWYCNGTNGGGEGVVGVDGVRIPLQVTIREIATGAVQESQTFGMTVWASGIGF